MSLFMLEGFDDGLAIERWAASGIVDTDISATYGRHGKGVVLGDTYGNYLLYEFDPDIDEILVGFAFNVSDIGSTASEMVGFSSYYNMRMNDSNNSILVYNPVVGNTYSDANVFSLDTWHYLEIHYFLSDTAGSYEVWIDGSSILSVSGVDTKYLSGLLSYLRVASSVDAIWIDDLYVLTGTGLTPLGDIEIATLLPNGNGNTSGMTGSDSNQTDNYLLVDNNAAIPPATTEYVGSATQGHLDTYTMEDLTGTPTVLGVQGSLYAEMTDTGPKSMRPILRSGTTDYSGTTVPLMNSAHKVIDEVWEDDPDTATQWTYTGVNAMEFGQEVRDS